MTRFPQILLNVPTARRVSVAAVPEIVRAIAQAEAKLKGRGRVLVRPSGTESKVRVMVEGKDRRETEALARDIARVVTKLVGEKSPPPRRVS
jgi:phosphoglucosamine mutase